MSDDNRPGFVILKIIMEIYGLIPLKAFQNSIPKKNTLIIMILPMV